MQTSYHEVAEIAKDSLMHLTNSCNSLYYDQSIIIKLYCS